MIRSFDSNFTLECMNERLFSAQFKSMGRPLASTRLGVSLLALSMALVASEARAGCAQNAPGSDSVTCTGATTIATTGFIGQPINATAITTVTVAPNATVDSDGTAISLGDNAQVTIGAGATVHSHSQGPGPNGIGANTIEVNNNSRLDIYGTALSDANGFNNTALGDEVINPLGNGNTIVIHQGGRIATLRDGVSTIWFQNLAGSSTLPNTVTNFGTIQAGASANDSVIGNAGNIVVNFENGATGVVNGNLTLGGGADSVILRGGSQFNGSISTGGGDDIVRLYKGATVTGTIDGGSGTNALFLSGDATDPGNASVIPGSVTNFNTLTKDGTSTWTISGSLSQLGTNSATIAVNQGVLVLTGNNDSFQGTTAIATGGTLQLGAGGAGGSLPGAIANNGVLALDRTDDYTLSGAISGTGLVQQIGTGITRLSGPLSGVTLRVDAGELVLPAGQSLSTNGLPVVQGGFATAAYLTGGTLTNAGTITTTQATNADAVRIEPGAILANSGAITGTTSGVFAPVGGTVTNTGSILGATGIVFGNGAATGGLLVTGNGTITGTVGDGITASNAASDVTLGTQANPLGAVNGQYAGLNVQGGSAGRIAIVTQGAVTGLTGAGIAASIRDAGNAGTVNIAASGSTLR